MISSHEPSALISAICSGVRYSSATLRSHSSGMSTASSPPPPTFAVAEVVRGEPRRQCAGSGTMDAIERVSVGAQATGQLKSLKVALGDRVTRGQLVAEIDDLTQQNELRNTQAALQTRRAERAARLAAEARAGDLEIARAALETARLEVTQAHGANAVELSIKTRLFAFAHGEVELEHTIDGQTITDKVAVQKGENVFTHNVTISNPRIWWPAGQGGQPVRLRQADAVLHPVLVDVDAGDRERLGGDVGRIHRDLGIRHRRQHREAAVAGAQVQHAAGALAQPGVDAAVGQQLRDEAARHDGALVHVEGHPLQPGFARQVGGRLARGDALVDQRVDGRLLGRIQRPRRDAVEVVQRRLLDGVRVRAQVEGPAHEPRGGAIARPAVGPGRGRDSPTRRGRGCPMVSGGARAGILTSGRSPGPQAAQPGGA